MAATTKDDATKTGRIGARHYVAIFLLSFATLLLELSLTRVLSVAMFYHFGFLVISTALLGFGVSGVVVTPWRELRERIPLDRALAWIAAFWPAHSRSHGLERCRHDHWHGETPEELGGEGIVQGKGGRHSITLVPGIADHFHIALSKWWHDYFRHNSVVAATARIVKFAVPSVWQPNLKIQRRCKSAFNSAVSRHSPTGRDNLRRECCAPNRFSGKSGTGCLCGDCDALRGVWMACTTASRHQQRGHGCKR